MICVATCSAIQLLAKSIKYWMPRWQVFGEKSYDALDLNDDEFMNDYEKFESSIADLDRRLAAIICQGFEDCSGLESAFRV